MHLVMKRQPSDIAKTLGRSHSSIMRSLKTQAPAKKVGRSKWFQDALGTLQDAPGRSGTLRGAPGGPGALRHDLGRSGTL